MASPLALALLLATAPGESPAPPLVAIMVSATVAPARLIVPSSASDSMPTDPVSHHASVLSAMVATAAARDSARKTWISSIWSPGMPGALLRTCDSPAR